jgi:hypothetical protein
LYQGRYKEDAARHGNEAAKEGVSKWYAFLFDGSPPGLYHPME